jgi:hypothetical protein
MNELYKALANVKRELSVVTTDRVNPVYSGSGYATLHNIMTVLQPLLDKNNLVLYSEFARVEMDKWVVRSTLVHIGEKEMHSLFVDFPVERVADSQNNGKVMTYARRYNIGALFNLTFEDDKDDDDTGDTKQTTKVAPTPLKF